MVMKKLKPMNSPKSQIEKTKVNRTNKVWSPEEEEKVWELYKKGYGFKGIASILGRTSYGVSKHITSMKKQKAKVKVTSE